VDDEFRQYFDCKPKGRDYLEDLGLDGSIIFEWILEKWGSEGVDWIHVAQNRVQ
jgi:hypothetical protein